MYKPFFNWTGNKRQLAPLIEQFIPDRYGRYLEPFCGAGNVFFHQIRRQAYLSDSNWDLVNAYIQVKHNLQSLIAVLGHMQERFNQDRESTYYGIRKWDREPDYQTAYSAIDRAARFLFLCQTAFNSVYRVNKDGQFNVPLGQRKSYRICDESLLLEKSEALQDVEIQHCNFDVPLESIAQKGDFIYVDPPYYPVSDTASFTSYTSDGFDLIQHITLSYHLRIAHVRGIKWLLSNSDTPWVRKEYADYRIVECDRAGTMNSDPKKRGRVKELLIMNY